jgi:hypothetical protein
VATVHCYPVDDVVEHDTEDDTGCVCGPDAELVENPDGPDGWLIKHHSLDGREINEEVDR